MAPERCFAHDGNRVLAGHDGAAQIHRHHAIECIFGDFGDLRVAARDADADVVVQDVEPAPPSRTLVHRRRDLRLAGHVRLEGRRLPAFRGDQPGRLGGRGRIAIDAQDSRTLSRIEQRGGTAVAHALARTLPRAHDDRRLPFQSHRSLPGSIAGRARRAAPAGPPIRPAVD